MKKTIFGIILFSFLFIIQHQCYALVVPSKDTDLKINHVKASTIGNTYVEMQFNARNYEKDISRYLEVSYKRKGSGKEPKAIAKDDFYYYFEDGVNYANISGLLPETKYIVFFKIRNDENDELIKVKRINITTKESDPLQIINYSSDSVNGGDELIVYGEGFGNKAGQVKQGYGMGSTSSTILFWSPTEIKINIREEATDGPIFIYAFPIPTMWHAQYAATATGPNLDIQNESHNFGYICTGIIANTYEELVNFNNIYQDEYGRPIKCDELVFHVQRTTSHDRLRSWLEEQDDGILWQNLMDQYDNKLIYNEDKEIYWVKDNTLYMIGSLWTAAAYGLIPDNAIYVSEDDLVRSDDSNIYDNFHSTSLPFINGPYYKKVLKLAAGKNVSFNDKSLDDYYQERKDLFAAVGDDEICDFVACGMIY